MKKRTIFPNACLISYGRLNMVKGEKRMSGKKKDDPKEGVTLIILLRHSYNIDLQKKKHLVNY